MVLYRHTKQILGHTPYLKRFTNPNTIED